MKTLKTLIATAALATAMVSAGSANAAVLTLGAGWLDDTTNNTTSPSVNSALTFTIGAGQQAYFRLTDAFATGDIYTIRDSVTNALIGTSSYTTDGASVPSYYGTSWSDTNYSRFSILLGAGSYSFNIFGNCGGGCPAGLAERLDAAPPAVPEPASWAMMILGMGAVGFAMRRRGQVKTSVRFA